MYVNLMSKSYGREREKEREKHTYSLEAAYLLALNLNKTVWNLFFVDLILYLTYNIFVSHKFVVFQFIT